MVGDYLRSISFHCGIDNMIYSYTNYNDDFIAGFWEGDGTMYFCKRINAPVIKVGSNNKDLILKIQKRLGKGYIDENDRHSKLVYMCWKKDFAYFK